MGRVVDFQQAVVLKCYYGKEISDTLVSLEAYDLTNNKWINIPKSDCEFGYRTSRFKSKDKNKFLISSITLHVTNQAPLPPFYPALVTYFEQKSIKEFTPQNIRNAVVEIRKSKLPDISKIANNGSFFTNPVVTKDKFNDVREKYPEVTFWDEPNGNVKLSAAYLIEQVGFKNYHDEETGMATWQNQPLIFVNEHARSTDDLLKFKKKVVDKVSSVFGITLEQEPEIISYE